MRPDIFLATIGRGSNGSNALEVTEDRAAVTAESQDNIINRVNNVSQYGPSWHYVPGIGVAGTAYAEVPDRSLGDLAFTRASSKTRTNAAGVVQTIGNNVPPHDYRNADGTLSTFPRLNLEPQRTNSLRNSSMVGAVAGSPGTLPTNWSISAAAGLTQTVVGAGTENGLPYIDLRFNGTASASALRFTTDANTAIAALPSQIWTSSCYFKLLAGVLPYITLRNIYRNAGSGAIITPQQQFDLTSTLTRRTFTDAGAPALTAFVQQEVLVSLVIGQTFDFTIRIAAPQMELGAYATTWVPTTTAAVTRIADTASKTGISSLIGQTAGTIFADLSYIATSTASARWFNVFGTTQNIALASNGINQIRVITNALSDTLSTAPTSNTGIKIAFAYNNSGVVCFINGTQYTLTNGGGQVMTSLTSIAFDLSLATGVVEAKINQAALFPTRLTNAQLAQMTTL